MTARSNIGPAVGERKIPTVLDGSHRPQNLIALVPVSILARIGSRNKVNDVGSQIMAVLRCCFEESGRSQGRQLENGMNLNF